MPATTSTDLLQLQTDVWKIRAQAKQKQLGHTLAQLSPRDAKRQTMWIKQALDTVKRGQDELKYQTALLDVYAQHLNALEMSLLAASEHRSPQ